MRARRSGGLGLASVLVLVLATQSCSGAPTARPPSLAPTLAPGVVRLPPPRTDGSMSLEEALAGRRSVRAFAPRPLSTAQIGQLLWAAQGVTDSQGHRTAPSAGACYPLELYAVSVQGMLRYLPDEHALAPVSGDDLRPALRAAALGQAAVGSAPLVAVIVAVPSRTAGRYGEARATRYVQLEAGHAAQNLLLEAVVLGLGAVPIGAFDDAAVSVALRLPADRMPLYLVPVGYPAMAPQPSAGGG